MASRIVDVSNQLDGPVLYPRGFYFASEGREELDQLPHYTMRQLPGHVLQHDEVLECDVRIEGDSFLVVLGKAYPLSTGPIPSNRASVAEELWGQFAAHGVEAVERALYDLAGRYAIILHADGRTVAYNDAAGTRSVFYDASRRRISSHYNILVRDADPALSDGRLPANIAPQVRWTTTPHKSIRALMANQRLELEAGSQKRFFPVAENQAASLDHETRMELLERLWEEQLQWLESMDVPLAMSVTGGLDSRFMLAMAGERKDIFRAMTYTTPEALRGEKPVSRWSEVMYGDQEIVKKLAPLLPEDHNFICRTDDAAWVTAGKRVMDRNATSPHGRWILPGYLTLFSRRDSVHYRGNLLEIGRFYLGQVAGNLTGTERLEKLTRGSCARFGPDVEKVAMAHLRGGMKQLSYDVVPDCYAFSDLFYWENRHSRWYSQVLNETDVAFDTITPFNVRRIIDIFLSYDVKDRKAAFLQREMIYRKQPLLTFFGYNETSDLYRKHVSDGRPVEG